MEIRLDDSNAKINLIMLEISAKTLVLDGITSEISGKSETLEKFMESYREFGNVLNKYQLALIKDIQSVSEIVSTWAEKDQILGGQIKGTETYTGMPEISNYKEYKEGKQ